jgi:hypothetical protein
MLIPDIQRQVHEKCLAFRTLDRLVASPVFEECFNGNPPSAELLDALNSGNTAYVQKWLDDRLTSEVGEYSLRRLRELGRRIGISQVTTYSKDDLLIEIVQRRRNHASSTEKVAG